MRHRCWLIISLILLLPACGGGTNSAGTPSGPTGQDLDSALTAFLHATVDLATSKVTLSWYDTFPDASRYQIEQQSSDGTWFVIDGVWATGQPSQPPTSLQWTGPVSAATTFRVSAVMSGYTVPLKTSDPQAAIQVMPPSPTPIIVLDQPEPVENPGISIAQGGSYQSVDYNVDSSLVGSSSGSGPTYPATLSTSTLTTGTHVLTASLLIRTELAFLITRSVRIHTSGVAIDVNVVAGPTTLDIYSIATSDSGVVSVEASFDNSPLGSLSAPNACSPTPCASGQPLNAYHFSFAASTVSTGNQHYVTTRASESTGSTAEASSFITLPSPTTAMLASPVDGATVQQTLHASGTISSGTPGALELMLTLSGVPVYDTTVANPGAAVPFSTDISLSGVTPGNHTLDVYGRVGNTNYALLTSALVTVAAPP